jgi:hypothetical protein
MRDTQRRRCGWGLLVVVALGGCGPSASGGGSVTPGGGGSAPDGAPPEGPHEGDNIGDLKARLERLRIKQLEMASDAEASFGVCEDLCSLAQSICAVTEKLCEVADRHPGEEEYQGLCRKAALECSEAEESCVTCVEARESRKTSKATTP